MSVGFQKDTGHGKCHRFAYVSSQVKARTVHQIFGCVKFRDSTRWCGRVAQKVFVQREQGDAGESEAVQSGYGDVEQTHALTDITAALDSLLAESVVDCHQRDFHVTGCLGP